MYYHVCPYCGDNLDPGERCNCQDEKQKYIRKCEEVLEIQKDGQVVIKEAIAC